MLNVPKVNDGRSRRYTKTEPSNMSNLEYEAVQRKTFARWMNTYLKEKNIIIEGETLMGSLSDGIVLIELLQLLTHENIDKYNKNPSHQLQKIENLQHCINLMQKHHVQLINIGADDIESGNTKIVLGLLWRLILKYQIHKNNNNDNNINKQKSNDNSAKRELLNFVNSRINKYNVKVANFSSHFQDGRALTALCNCLGESLKINNDDDDDDDDDNDNDDNVMNVIQNALHVATNKYEIPPIMDAEDIVTCPDSHSMMTYISYFKDKILEMESKRKHKHIEETKCHIPNEAIYINEECHINIISELESINTLQATLTFEDNLEKINIIGDKIDANTYDIKFIPKKVGKYNIEIDIDNIKLPNSYVINSNAQPIINFEKSYIEIISKTAECGKPAQFIAHIRDQYGQIYDVQDVNVLNTKVIYYNDNNEEIICGLVDKQLSKNEKGQIHMKVIINASENQETNETRKYIFKITSADNDQQYITGFKDYVLFEKQHVKVEEQKNEEIQIEKDDKSVQTDMIGVDIDHLKEIEILFEESKNNQSLNNEEDDMQDDNNSKEDNFTKTEPFNFDHNIQLNFPKPNMKSTQQQSRGTKTTTPNPFALGRVRKNNNENNDTLHWKQAASLSKLLSRVEELSLSESKLLSQVDLMTSRLKSLRDEFRKTKRNMEKEKTELIRDLVEAQSELEKRGGYVARSKVMQEARHLLSGLKPWVGIQIGRGKHKRHRSAEFNDDDDDDEEERDVVGNLPNIPAVRSQTAPKRRHRRSISDSGAMEKIVKQYRDQRKQSNEENNNNNNNEDNDQKNNMNNKHQTKNNDNNNSGVRVAGVIKGSPAITSGFQKDDIIESADGEDVNNTEELRKVIHSVLAGDTISFQVRRQNTMINLQVHVGTKRIPFENIVILRRVSQGIVRKGDETIIKKVKRVMSRQPKSNLNK